VVWIATHEQRQPGPPVTTFEECVAAGYPVLESYPPRCLTLDGETFTQEIGNELEKSDLIRIDHPRPNQTITSPLTLSGRARGQWYFEATFPVRLLDADGTILAESDATAQGEWMTEEFVPFTATLEFTAPAATSGTLILVRANPSGDPARDEELIVPVRLR
jgi:hypothetical protein